MTFDEAKKLAEIAAGVDGGCSVCVEQVTLELNEAFPEFVWTFEKKKGSFPTVNVKPAVRS